MKNLFIPLMLVSLLAGCAEIPFRETPPWPVADFSPEKVVAAFKERSPQQISMLNSIVFEFAGQKFLGVGFIEVKPSDRSFRVICLNPMGVKLFDLSGEGEKVVTNFVLEPLASQGDIASAIAFDIKRIYFDQLPAADAVPRKLKNSLIFGKALSDGYLEHVFAGADGDLVEKRFYQDQVISWSVGYYEYGDHDGKRSPKGVILTDYKGGYRLIVREKEQTVEKDQE